MIFAKHLLIPFITFLLVIGISLGQGPKKDVGANVALPPGIDEDNKPPQKHDSLPKIDTLKLDVDLVNVDVVVTDNDGHPITGLTQDQFKVFDDNVQQQITNFSITDLPVTVATLMEYVGNPRKVIPPALGFVDSLRPNDWGALIVYDHHTTIVTDFTNNKSELSNALRNLGPPRYHEADLWDSLHETLQLMGNIDGRKAIFLLSSGLDTGDFHAHTYPDMLKETEASDTIIYAVSTLHTGARGTTAGGLTGNAFLQGTTFVQADNALKSLAENTGGAAFFPEFVAEYPGIYQTIRAQLQNSYSLGFVPTNRKADGKFHKLRVEAMPFALNRNGKPDKIKVRYKQGYYAAKS
jgi:VWFA-related protein